MRRALLPATTQCAGGDTSLDSAIAASLDAEERRSAALRAHDIEMDEAVATSLESEACCSAKACFACGGMGYVKDEPRYYCNFNGVPGSCLLDGGDKSLDSAIAASLDAEERRPAALRAHDIEMDEAVAASLESEECRSATAPLLDTERCNTDDAQWRADALLLSCGPQSVG